MFLIVHLLATAGSLAASAYLLLLPLLNERRHRGDFLYGHYALQEVYLGLPLLLIALVLSVLWLIPKDKRPKFTLRFGFLTGALLAAVFAFDLMFALILQGGLEPNYWLDGAHISRAQNEADEELGFRRKPNVEWQGYVTELGRDLEYRSDAKGFRNPADAPTAADIAFVGDSYTEAAQVPIAETFAQLVGRATENSVLNYGRGAYGPQQEALVLRRFALAQDPAPKVIVWQLFEGNDLKDAVEFAAWKENPNRVRAGLLDRYLANSFFVPFLLRTYESKKKRFDWTGSALSNGRDDWAVRYKLEVDPFKNRSNAWPGTEAALREGIAAAREAGSRVVLMYVPTAARVLHDKLKTEDQQLRGQYFPDGGLDVRPFLQRVQTLAQELGVPLLDLYPVFRAHVQREGGSGIFIPDDEHLDLEGHRLVSEALAPLISK